MSDCIHKINKLSYADKCKGLAALCQQSCKRKTNHQQNHLIEDVETIEVEYEAKKARLSSKSQVYRNNLKDIYQGCLKQLKQKYQDSQNQIQNQINFTQSSTPKQLDIITKIDNKRWDKLLCSEVYIFKNINHSAEVNLQKLKKIVDQFKTYTTNVNHSALSKIKKENANIKKQNIQLKKQCQKLKKIHSNSQKNNNQNTQKQLNNQKIEYNQNIHIQEINIKPKSLRDKFQNTMMIDQSDSSDVIIIQNPFIHQKKSIQSNKMEKNSSLSANTNNQKINSTQSFKSNQNQFYLREQKINKNKKQQQVEKKPSKAVSIFRNKVVEINNNKQQIINPNTKTSLIKPIFIPIQKNIKNQDLHQIKNNNPNAHSIPQKKPQSYFLNKKYSQKQRGYSNIQSQVKQQYIQQNKKPQKIFTSLGKNSQQQKLKHPKIAPLNQKIKAQQNNVFNQINKFKSQVYRNKQGSILYQIQPLETFRYKPELNNVPKHIELVNKTLKTNQQQFLQGAIKQKSREYLQQVRYGQKYVEAESFQPLRQQNQIIQRTQKSKNKEQQIFTNKIQQQQQQSRYIKYSNQKQHILNNNSKQINSSNGNKQSV